ncbi:hypothetical protein Pmani_034699 [Petrolisthes manimaculis]|uniref:BHLH domain-containing protein n=1 Tax=Petrolisthes manimaculis TaxID=1843537 RepID=A0AAE1TRA0_9EUCA|nr:hypothetical protein Pmani_034699 [Petrolisthes manimaculis]
MKSASWDNKQMPRNVRPGRGQPEVRQERQEIREYLDKLRQLVPGCPKAGKLSRLAVIQHVIDYIVELQDTLVHHPVNSILANPDLQDLATSISTHPDHHYYPHNPDYSPPSSLNPGEEDLSLTTTTTPTTTTTTPPLHQDQEYSNSLHPNYPTPPHQSYDDDYHHHHHQQDSTNTPLHHENHDYTSPPPHHQQKHREVYRRGHHHHHNNNNNNEEVYSNASHPHNRHYSAPHHTHQNNEEVYSSASHSRHRHYSAPHRLHNQEVYNAPHHSIEKDSVQPTTTTITTTTTTTSPPDVTKTNRKHTNTSTGSCRRPLGVLSSLKTHRNQ